VRWVHPTGRTERELILPSGRLRLTDCTIRGLGAGIECRTLGALVVEAANVLAVDSGPLIVLDHCPGADEPIAVRLLGVTLRGPSPVVECRCGPDMGPPGKVRIEAAGCVLATGPGTGLLSLVGVEPPTALLGAVEWTGQGSLMSPEAAVAVWRRPAGGAEALDDSAVSIAGLVRSEVEFAGQPNEGPEASRITRWQAPLLSEAPPGVDPTRLR